MKRDTKARKTRSEVASLEETALYMMFLSEALFEVLAKKGLITHDEMAEQMTKLRNGARLKSAASD
jgi:hypothetical protein